MRANADAVLLDTGVLLAVLDDRDPHHEPATKWLARSKGKLHTVGPVLAEAAYFLSSSRRAVLAEMASGGMLKVHEPDAAGYKRVAAVLRKYADLRADWADAMLVWLAEESGIHRIATVDVRDFSAYRIHGRAKFHLEPLG